MMIKPLSIAAASAALPIASAAIAAPQIVSKDSRGRATDVLVNGQNYAVCNAQKKDECINAREAGLKWGNRALAYWPGKRASEVKPA